jgi:hypothetical protein
MSAEEQMLLPLLILVLLSQADWAEIDSAHSVEPPETVIGELEFESVTMPHEEAVSFEPPLMLRSVPEVPSRQTQVGLD